MSEPVTYAEYIAAADALLRATELEEAKAGEGEAAMAAWAVVAIPRFEQLSAVLDRAEAEDPVQAAAWYAVWRAARQRDGRWPFAVDVAPAAPIAPAQGSLL